MLSLGVCSSLHTSSGQLKGWDLCPFLFGTARIFEGTCSGATQFSQFLLTSGISYAGIFKGVPILGMSTRKDFQVTSNTPYHPSHVVYAGSIYRTTVTEKLLESLQTLVCSTVLSESFLQQ